MDSVRLIIIWANLYYLLFTFKHVNVEYSYTRKLFFIYVMLHIRAMRNKYYFIFGQKNPTNRVKNWVIFNGA